MKKLFSLSSIAFVFLFSLTACYPKWIYHAPDYQVFSHWESENGRVVMEVPELEYTNGIILTADGPVEVDFIIHFISGEMEIYPIGSEIEISQSDCFDYDNYEPLEEWKTDFSHYWDRFEVTVIESTYFTPGEKFTVYRTVKGITHKDYLKFCKKNPEANLSYGEYCEQYSAGD